jgi:hypothetical protein
MYYGDPDEKDNVEYEILSPEEYKKMDEQAIKNWYNSRRSGRK